MEARENVRRLHYYYIGDFTSDVSIQNDYRHPKCMYTSGGFFNGANTDVC